MTVLQGLPPVVARTTRLVVLGSFPGAASLAAQQYYAHPRNHFWPIVSALWGIDLLALPYQKRLALLRQRRAAACGTCMPRADAKAASTPRSRTRGRTTSAS